jgi:FtsZ-binding cell division protein ZapB
MIEASSYMDKIIDELEESIDKLIDANDKLIVENRELKQENAILVEALRDLQWRMDGLNK